VRALVDAAQELLEKFAPARHSQQDEAHAQPAAESVPATCEWCPLCTLAALVRGQHTELARTALEYGGVLLGLLRAVLDEAVQHKQHGSPRAAGAEPGEAGSSPEGTEAPSKVQRIPVRRSPPAGWD
jgi:hypothetical protein